MYTTQFQSTVSKAVESSAPGGAIGLAESGGVGGCHWSHKQEPEETVVNAGGNQPVRSTG